MDELEQARRQEKRQFEGPDPEVVPGAPRRLFSREYKLRILAEVDACARGEVGAVLRREGLRSSLVSKWRQQQAEGRLDEPDEREQQRVVQAQARELEQLKREKARLEAQLARAEAVIEVQKKLYELLEADED